MRALLLLLLVLLAGPVRAADQVLAPSGTLRAGYILTNVAQARVDPATGTVSGVIADVARDLARRADVPVTIMPLPTAAAVDYTLRDAVEWLKNGEVIAFAGGRQRLASATRDVSGLRMLDDNFYAVPQAVAVPLDRPDRLRFVNAALADMRSTGFIADSFARSGIEGLSVAPPDPP